MRCSWQNHTRREFDLIRERRDDGRRYALPYANLTKDNKYSCEACGRHVDAVKQVTIKSLPDNLIFHLKRFEYDVNQNKRTKVNDYFKFPTEIDLFPYTLDQIELSAKGITRPREETQQIYDLVGVLVHTGNAESGHYYSYIRDSRPAGAVPDPRVQWYEFNDSDVKPWRVDEMEHWCFGGPERNFDPAYYAEAPMKNFSAYMLFYRKREKPDRIPQTLEVKYPPRVLNLKV